MALFTVQVYASLALSASEKALLNRLTVAQERSAAALEALVQAITQPDPNVLTPEQVAALTEGLAVLATKTDAVRAALVP